MYVTGGMVSFFSIMKGILERVTNVHGLSVGCLIDLSDLRDLAELSSIFHSNCGY